MTLSLKDIVGEGRVDCCKATKATTSGGMYAGCSGSCLCIEGVLSIVMYSILKSHPHGAQSGACDYGGRMAYASPAAMARAPEGRASTRLADKLKTSTTGTIAGGATST